VEIFLPRESYNPNFEIIDLSVEKFGVFIYFPEKGIYTRAEFQEMTIANF
jgi:hypothetical protein